MSGYTYLSSPYSHPDPAIREARFHAACKAAAQLMAKGDLIFSPIAHSHSVEMASGKVNDGAFWKRQDVPLLRHADKMIVLQLPGWVESKGIAWEIEMARSLNIPVEFMEPV